jgi:hypothetical protein
MDSKPKPTGQKMTTLMDNADNYLQFFYEWLTSFTPQSIGIGSEACQRHTNEFQVHGLFCVRRLVQRQDGTFNVQVVNRQCRGLFKLLFVFKSSGIRG